METRLVRLACAALAAVPLLVAGCASQPAEQPPESQPPAVEPPSVTPSPEEKSEPLVLRPDYPERYVVRRGDTLWDISDRFLRDPWRWPELWQKNPRIANPHLIYPGDVLTLVYIDGRPTLQVQRQGTSESGQYPTVKLSPRVREEALERAIPTIPVNAIKQFLSRPFVLAAEEIEALPYIVSSPEQHLVTGAGDRVYVRRLDGQANGEFVVVRRGREYRDPETDELLGIETIYVGDARFERLGDPATVRLLRSQREVLIGDRLLEAVDQGLFTHLVPKVPEQAIEGRIISLVDAVSQTGQYQVVVLNRGLRDGIETGHVLAVYQSSGEIRDTVAGGTVTLPDERAGIVMVFRPFERVSYALVMQSTRAIHLNDRVVRP